MDHFWPLAPDLLKTDSDDREISKAILAKGGISGYQLGTTKVRHAAGQHVHMGTRQAGQSPAFSQHEAGVQGAPS